MALDFRIHGTFLGSRFGRRIFLMFCLAAVVPAAAVFWITYRAAAAESNQVEQATLHLSSKEFALGVYSRLELADEAFGAVDADAISRGEGQRLLAMYFTDVAAIGPSSTADTHGFAAELAGIAAESPLASRLRVVASPEAGSGDAAVNRHAVILLRPLAGQQGDLLFAGRLKPSFLWGDPDAVGHAVRICAHARGIHLFCGGDVNARRHDAALLEREWTLFLKPRFGAPEWTFVSSAAPVKHLQNYSAFLAPVAAGVLLLAMLLSSIQIRRVLVPMVALLTRIRTFESGSMPVQGHSAEDEFGVLSKTFGDMERRIGLQMETLRTLSEVDRLILARAPLADVVDLVMSRIQRIVETATVCIGVSTPGAPASATYYLRPRNLQWTEAGDDTVVLAALAPAHRPSMDMRWLAVEEIDAGVLCEAFRRCGDGVAWVMAPDGQGDVRVCAMLGFPQRLENVTDFSTQIGELTERVAVAVAFAARENLLVFQAHHDSLTGLPNRLATYETLAASIAEARSSAGGFAVIFLDLDRFKSINDGLGHTLGDEVLVKSGERIRESIAPGDFVGRFGGDEFFVILPQVYDVDRAAQATAAITDRFATAITAGNREFHQRLSAGIAFYPRDGEDASTLIRNADVAMYRGKKAGGGRTEFFTAAMNAEARAHVQMEHDLRLAIHAGQIEVHYQPRVDSRSGRIVGAEALARWTHQQNGNIPTPVFIALAEESGLIDDLGRHVLEEACRQWCEWRAQGFKLPLIAVNVSSHQLRSGRFVEVVRQVIDASGMPPSALEIEVTETILVCDSGSGSGQLQGLRDMGVTIAIDDFGTGFSSLAYLAKLPSDTLKIDRAFIVDLAGGDVATAAIVRSIIAVAGDLQKNVVAEGAESMAQVEMLAAMGCHTIQGYVYYRPMSAGDMTQALDQHPGVG